MSQPLADWTDEEVIAQLYRAGDLTWKCLDHQAEHLQKFNRWNAIRNTRAERARCKELGALFDHLTVWEWGRRTGKTALALLIAVMAAIQRPGSRGMIAVGHQKNIGSILIPLIKSLFGDAPPGFFPTYKGSHGADHEGIRIAATDSYIKLVGCDLHPGATRGQYLDFCVVTEAAFVGGLYELVTATINPQMLGRPHAWLLLESSTSLQPDHDFSKIFREDAKLRGTYSCLTIDDNTSLSVEERDIEIRRCGGVNSAIARRELYCEQVRDADTLVVPEFDEARHCVASYPTPTHAISYTVMDPGSADFCGLVWAYVDWLHGRLIVQAAWAKANQSTRAIAEVVRVTEQKLWGVTHRDLPDGLPFTPPATAPSFDMSRAMLAAPVNATREHREQPMIAIDGAEPTQGGKVWHAPEHTLTYWDPLQHTLKPNPYERISDQGDPQARNDLRSEHALDFTVIDKGARSHDSNLQQLRLLFSQGRIVILKNGKTDPLIDQLRSGTWNKKRSDWSRSPTLGHLDCIAACTYLVRAVDWRRNPYPPLLTDVHAADVQVPQAQATRVNQILNPKRGGRGVYSPRR